MSKHLCGCACDFTIDAIRRYIEERRASPSLSGAAPLSWSSLSSGPHVYRTDFAHDSAPQEGQSSVEQPCARDAPDFPGYQLSSLSTGSGLPALFVATCCHYLCSWETYCNIPFITALGFSKLEFSYICAVSHWATMNGGERSDSSHIDSSDNKHAQAHFMPAIFVSPHLSALICASRDSRECEERSLTVTEKVGALIYSYFPLKLYQIQLGRMCKQLLDVGRAQLLQQLGYSGLNS